MKDIDELQRRITAAMDRVAQGLEKIGNAPAEDPQTAQALEDERTANAQLTDRVRMLRNRLENEKAKSENEMAALRKQVEDNLAQVTQLDIELQRVRRTNTQLSDNCEALRKANLEGVGNAQLINTAMLTELESLRAARAADVAEASAIVAVLTPLIEDATAANDANTPENEEKA